jgi:DNA-binding beta-propeller fold protein YncE
MHHRLNVAVLSLFAAGLASAALAAPNYGVTDHLKGAGDGGWDYASFDPVHGRVFISRAGGVTVVDVATKSVSVLTIPGSGRMHESLPLDHGRLLLVTDGNANAAHLIDASAGAGIADIPTGQKPDAAVFDPASGLALVMNGHSGTVTMIDPATRKAVGDITLGGSLEFAAADGKGKVFVNIEDQNQIAVIDTEARSLAGHYGLPGCTSPGGIAYAPGAGVLIVACQNKVAKVLNAVDGRDLDTLTIGAGPDAVFYDATRHLAFIPCGRDGVLEVIAVRSPADVAVVQIVPTELGARTGAVDPASGVIYLPTAKYQIAPNGLPSIVPGTFEVVVVSPGKAGD